MALKTENYLQPHYSTDDLQGKKTKPCLYCQELFPYQKKSAKYCCVSCGQKHKKSQEPLPTDAVSCAICGFQASSLINHIIRTHHISLEEYRTQYPDAQVNSPTYLQQLSERTKGEKNPGWKHGGKFSSLSKNFIHAKITDAASIRQKISDSNKHNGNNSTTLQYWLNQGLTEDQAKVALSERQSTFSLEKCIAKHGPDKGTEIWTARQQKWMENNKKSNYSLVSQKLFLEIVERNPDIKQYSHFANHPKEMTLILNNKCIRPDFHYLKDGCTKVIEFDGDYWHGPKRGNQERDREKDELYRSNNIIFMRVLERDYKSNPSKVIQECIEFLTR
jgi:hypothetical protein